jgi:lipoteichoic acid synthase
LKIQLIKNTALSFIPLVTFLIYSLSVTFYIKGADEWSLIFLAPGLFVNFYIYSFISAVIFILLGKWKLVSKLFLSVVLISMITGSAVQINSLFFSNDLIGVDALHHADQIFFLISRESITIVAIAFIYALFTIVLIITVRDTKERSLKKSAIPMLVLLSAVYGVLYVPSLFSKEHREAAFQEYQLQNEMPDIAMYHTFYRYFFGMEETEFVFSKEEKDYLETFGIKFDLYERYPFIRKNVYRKPLKYEKNEKYLETPNIIVFFVESLSAQLLGVYGSKHKNISPNIDAFAEESTVFYNYFNHATPTVNALRGTLCSYFPIFGHGYWRKNPPEKIKNENLLCFPEILSERGYGTYYFNHYDPDYTDSLNQMRLLGFSRQFYRDDISQKFLEGAKGRDDFGLTDNQMLSALKKFLEDRTEETPFFAALSTIDMHHPYRLAFDGVPYAGGKRSRVLNTVHSFDHAFGRFYEYFKNSAYFENTILVLTADHPMFATRAHREIRERGFKRWDFDTIALIIHHPGMDIPPKVDTLSSSLDFTPTFLHMLDINIENPFMGHSVFEDRKKYKSIIGVHNDNLFTVMGKKHQLHRKAGEIAEKCSLQEEYGDTNFEKCTMAKWFLYNRHIVNSNRIWRKD